METSVLSFGAPRPVALEHSLIDWQSNDVFKIKNQLFRCVTGNYYSYKTTAEEAIILKSRQFLERYIAVLDGIHPKRFLEFGIFEGGSPLFYSLLYSPDIFVTVDIRGWLAGYEECIRKNDLSKCIKNYYASSQIDGVAVLKILNEHFSKDPADIIIDDASHVYDFSVKTFEMAFPYLRPGGFYILEDWNTKIPTGINPPPSAPLSRLAAELLFLHGKDEGVIKSIHAWGPLLLLIKGDKVIEKSTFSISNYL